MLEDACDITFFGFVISENSRKNKRKARGGRVFSELSGLVARPISDQPAQF